MMDIEKDSEYTRNKGSLPTGEGRRGALAEDWRAPLSLSSAQRLVDEWIKTYGVRYFSELTNMACLTEEVGELARIMARTYGDQSFKRVRVTTSETKWQTCFGCCSALQTRLVLT